MYFSVQDGDPALDETAQNILIEMTPRKSCFSSHLCSIACVLSPVIPGKGCHYKLPAPVDDACSYLHKNHHSERSALSCFLHGRCHNGMIMPLVKSNSMQRTAMLRNLHLFTTIFSLISMRTWYSRRRRFAAYCLSCLISGIHEDIFH